MKNHSTYSTISQYSLLLSDIDFLIESISLPTFGKALRRRKQNLILMKTNPEIEIHLLLGIIEALKERSICTKTTRRIKQVASSLLGSSKIQTL